jgi:ABC-type branched-subunit amino acid transport system substrate-binding protein
MRNSIGLAIAPVVLPKAGTNIFQAAPVISQVVKPLVDGAKAQKITSLGVLYTSDAPGQAQLGAVTAAAKAAGIAVDSKPIEPTATDVSPQLLQLKSDGAQVIFSATLGAPTTTVLSSYHSLGMTIPLVVGAANVTNDFLNSISYGIPSTLYGISTMAKGDGFDAATAKAWSDYQRNYRKYAGEPVDSEGATGAYIACIAKEVIANTKGASGAAAQKYLEENTLTCLGSPIQFGVNGLNVANGVPNELLQAGRTADDGWVPVTTPL